MGFTTCVHCQTRILPDADGRCPSCGHLPGEDLDAASRAEIDRRLAEDARSDALPRSRREVHDDDLRLEHRRMLAILPPLGAATVVLLILGVPLAIGAGPVLLRVLSAMLLGLL